MFTNKKIILAATIAAQMALASNLLWFEDDNDETEGLEDEIWTDHDDDAAGIEEGDERRMLGGN